MGWKRRSTRPASFAGEVGKARRDIVSGAEARFAIVTRKFIRLVAAVSLLICRSGLRDTVCGVVRYKGWRTGEARDFALRKRALGCPVTGSEHFMSQFKISRWLKAALTVLICFTALPCTGWAQRPSAPSSYGTPGFPSTDAPGAPRRPAADVEAPAATGTVYSRVNVGDDYVLRPGDKVSFSVAEERKAPQELTVMASGEIDVPYIGRYSVAGRSCHAVEAGLKAELEKKYFKHATVTLALNQAGAMPLTGTSNIRVYFTGAIRAQGAREFTPDNTITVSKAILIAGGFSDFADQKKVQLIRHLPNGKSQITVVNVHDVLLGKPGNDPVLQGEDLIRVPEKLINF